MNNNSNTALVASVLDQYDSLDNHIDAHVCSKSNFTHCIPETTSKAKPQPDIKRRRSFVFQPVRKLSALQPPPTPTQSAPAVVTLASPVTPSLPAIHNNANIKEAIRKQTPRTTTIKPTRTRTLSAPQTSKPPRRRSAARAQAANRNEHRRHVQSCTCAKCRRLAHHRKLQPASFKFKTTTSIALVDITLQRNGLTRARGDRNDWCVLWTVNFRLHQYRALTPNQKVNQFPCTAEITRKDQLCRNVLRMQELHGQRHFDYFPQSYVLPQDSDSFHLAAAQSNNAFWIVKPAASAQGRGIFITDSVKEVDNASRVGVGIDSNLLVSRYISDPLLLDGRKFDLRIYVAVTSFNPLRVYSYGEGLVRLATEEYHADPESIKNRFIHLTNYSVQKKSKKFVENEPASDAEGHEAAHKWSLSTFRQRLKRQGIDDCPLWTAVHDIVIKTCVSIEEQVHAALDTHAIDPRHCFQLFGFDILVDSQLKPWLLEVNLSPSMACESELDLKIKGPLLADLLTLVEARPSDNSRNNSAGGGRNSKRSTPNGRQVGSSINTESKRAAAAAATAHLRTNEKRSALRAIRSLEEEEQRKGEWGRIFPLSDSWTTYKRFFQKKRPLNEIQASYLEQRIKFEEEEEEADRSESLSISAMNKKSSGTPKMKPRQLGGRGPKLKLDRKVSAPSISEREESDMQQQEPISNDKEQMVISMALGNVGNNSAVQIDNQAEDNVSRCIESPLNATHRAEIKHLARQSAATRRRKERANRTKGVFGLSEVF